MKAAYINPFVDAVIRLFQTMMTLTVTIGQPALEYHVRGRTTMSAA
jgi:CheY-specific phosphatase CheX